MFKAAPCEFLVPFEGKFELEKCATSVKEVDEKTCKKQLQKAVEELSDLQKALYAQNSHSLLVIFQAMDAAGKDSTIRSVLSGVNPAGCQVYSFKQPSAEELDHDFLWRSACRLPERGRIGVFNRSYYEDVLVVRVHPEYLSHVSAKTPQDLDELWSQRYQSIRDHELHMARNGTVILKFWLNVSRNEQARRFIDRLSDPEKNWKFSATDIEERKHWNAYMKAYEDALRETSRPWAPWYAIPADSKPYMRQRVAEIIVETLRSLHLSFPTVNPQNQAQFEKFQRALEAQLD